MNNELNELFGHNCRPDPPKPIQRVYFIGTTGPTGPTAT